LALLALVLTAPARLPAVESAGPPPGRPELLDFLEEGQELFHQASNLEDPEEAAILYRKALDRFVSVAQQGRVRNTRLYYNIANTHYRLGDLGKAILYYRRAELLNPADRNLRHNLEFVRSERVDNLPPNQLSRLARVLFFWHYLLSPGARLYLFAAVFAAACAVAALVVLAWEGVRPPRERFFFTTRRPGHDSPTRGPRSLLPVIIAGALAALLLASVVAGEIRLRTLRDGVIVADEVVVRKGDGTAYQPSFVDPLHQGAEFVLLENRSGWYYVRFSDGRTGWLPASAAEMIVER
jgi:hypothetical protein